ncbi:MAG: hemolysin III family protein [Chloroflexi bacterium]|nr:hemolysin III family protein [Chloroflexota bacterium]
MQKPLLRGWFHLGAAVAAILGLVLLLLLANSPTEYVGGAIFGAGLILLYATSAAYHRISWRPSLRAIVRRLDHAMIFVLIAATYTPIGMVVLSPAWWISMLSVVWGIAGAGIVMKVLWPGAPRWLSVASYVILGWLALVPAAELATRFTTAPLLLLLMGGVLYTLGGLVYATEKPNPFPRFFGYHEVFHLLGISGSSLHYSLVAIYVLR